MAKKLSQTQKEYRKQRRRVQQAVRRLEKIGYIFDENVVPKIPKKVTKASVQRLAKITPEKLREKSEYIIGEEVVKYKTHKKEIKQEIKIIRESLKQEQKKTVIDYIPTVSYIDNFRETVINSLPDSRAFYHGRNEPALFKDFSGYKNIIISLLDDSIAENGVEYVERLLEENAETLSDYIEGAQYDSDEYRVEHNLISVANILKGSPLTQIEAEKVSMLSEGSYEIED
nr:MAG TPA: hypothetical protein [Caudoviricetes sp.]